MRPRRRAPSSRRPCRPTARCRGLARSGRWRLVLRDVRGRGASDSQAFLACKERVAGAVPREAATADRQEAADLPRRRAGCYPMPKIRAAVDKICGSRWFWECIRSVPAWSPQFAVLLPGVSCNCLPGSRVFLPKMAPKMPISAIFVHAGAKKWQRAPHLLCCVCVAGLALQNRATKCMQRTHLVQRCLRNPEERRVSAVRKPHLPKRRPSVFQKTRIAVCSSKMGVVRKNGPCAYATTVSVGFAGAGRSAAQWWQRVAPTLTSSLQ